MCRNSYLWYNLFSFNLVLLQQGETLPMQCQIWSNLSSDFCSFAYIILEHYNFKKIICILQRLSSSFYRNLQPFGVGKQYNTVSYTVDFPIYSTLWILIKLSKFLKNKTETSWKDHWLCSEDSPYPGVICSPPRKILSNPFCPRWLGQKHHQKCGHTVFQKPFSNTL